MKMNRSFSDIKWQCTKSFQVRDKELGIGLDVSLQAKAALKRRLRKLKDSTELKVIFYVYSDKTEHR